MHQQFCVLLSTIIFCIQLNESDDAEDESEDKEEERRTTPSKAYTVVLANYMYIVIHT